MCEKSKQRERERESERSGVFEHEFSAEACDCSNRRSARYTHVGQLLVVINSVRNQRLNFGQRGNGEEE